jgi:non-heme chloroperoxidase
LYRTSGLPALLQRIPGIVHCMLLAAALVPGPAMAELRYQVVEGHGGVPLNVVSAGDASNPTLLLVHGIGQSSVSFEEQLVPALYDEFHLVTFDLRGHGNSGKPWEPEAYKDSASWAGDVRSIIEALELDHPVILGWSYGTLVVSDYLRHYGTDRLGGIVLTGAFGGLTTPPPPPDAAMAEIFVRNRALQLSANPANNAEAARTTAAMLTSRDMGEAWRQRAAQLAMMLPAYARTHMFERPLVNTDLVSRIDVPVMLVVGGKDGSTPEDAARALATQLVSQGAPAVVNVYAESGHSPFAEEPERFNGELLQFVREVTGAQSASAGR